MLLEGIQLGRYMLVKRIGGGGMGDVYLAEDPQIGQKVAIKVIKTEITLNVDVALMQDFQEEARAIAQLDHPHIMPLLAYGEQEIHGDTVAYIVMPYRKEGNLNVWLRQRSQTDKLSMVELGQLIKQAASALQYAHNRAIIHRDIKPANFLVRENPDTPRQPDLLLSDFGLAKLTNTTSSASQNVRGTPSYMPPEQWGGTAVAASDQYSLAVMAYELLCERTPFQGSPLQMMHQHMSAPPPPPTSFNPSLPEGVNDVLLCALRKNPADRYPSVSAFADNLDNALHGQPYEVKAVEAENKTVEADKTVEAENKAVHASTDETLVRTVPAKPFEDTQQELEQELLQKAAAQSTLYPTKDAITFAQSRKIRPLFVILAAVLALALVGGSMAFALSVRNFAGAGKLVTTSAQTSTGKNSSPGTHPTVQISVTSRPKFPKATPTKQQSTHGNGNATGNNGNSNTLTLSNPTPTSGSQSTSSSNPQPTPTYSSQPTPTPTYSPQPTPTPTPKPQPTLCLKSSSTSFSLSGTVGSTYSNEQYPTLTNCSSAAETWVSTQYTTDGNNWIRSSSTSSTINAGSSQTVGEFASLSGLGAGTYTGYLYFSINSTTQVTITITLVVQQSICLQSNYQSLSLSGTAGYTYSNEAYITLTNCSGAAETWVSTQHTTDGLNWIRSSSTSSTISAGSSQSVGEFASLSGLSAGTYTGYLYFNVNSTTQVTITITLVVN